ncbi:hypothetical protein HY798_04640 [Candidatus Falkowbacteria bacterium]|nr:hypothetical protein [Candidatus Falkowbacteria bacterium]
MIKYKDTNSLDLVTWGLRRVWQYNEVVLAGASNLKNMNKTLFILIGTVIVFGIAAFFLFAKEDPLARQAKEEVRQAEGVYSNFQNTVNAIPILELSSDVKNDFKIQAAYFGFIGYLEPDVEPPPARVVMHVGKLAAAQNARSSPKFIDGFDPEKDFGVFLKDILIVKDITNEDLGFLEKMTNVFDEAVKHAKANVPELVPPTIERNKKTEKHFLEFERIDQRLKALAASLDSYSSGEFRSKMEKLKASNEVFGELANYTYQLYSDKGWPYSFDIAKTFPELAGVEAAVKRCSLYNPRTAPTDCKPTAFMPGQYQSLFRELTTIYTGVIE